MLTLEPHPLDKIQAALALLSSEEPLLVAVSGGADSVALLHLLVERGYRELTVCHFDHQLRGAASQEDARFVEKLAFHLHLSCELGCEDVQARAKRHALSIETAAREARYEFFASVAFKKNVRTLLLAHHADDQVETCFFNYLRGTGSAGLAGMLPVSRRMIAQTELTLVRPLLSISKQELKKYLEERSLPFCHDASNESLFPTRNRLRHRLFPLLDEIVGSTYRNAILRTATILSAEDEYLESLAAPWAASSSLNVETISIQPLALRRRVIHRWLRNHDFCDVGFYEVELIGSLLNKDGPAKVNLPHDRHACRREGKIFLIGK